jgi:hypothetical protein
MHKLVPFFELKPGTKFKSVFSGAGVVEGVKTQPVDVGKGRVNCILTKEGKQTLYWIMANTYVEVEE